MNARQIVQVCIRASAVVISIWAVLVILPPVVEPLLWRDWSNIRYLRQPLFALRDQWQWVIPLVGLAILLWILQRPLARLIVPRFGPTCPECGYDLRGLKDKRCPECGAAYK